MVGVSYPHLKQCNKFIDNIGRCKVFFSKHLKNDTSVDIYIYNTQNAKMFSFQFFNIMKNAVKSNIYGVFIHCYIILINEGLSQYFY